tara:strand:+ start:414 stop:704 length:291 start_codon:yes stop_codon:yes gene_type:complete
MRSAIFNKSNADLEKACNEIINTTQKNKSIKVKPASFVGYIKSFMIFAINNDTLYTNYLKGLGPKRKQELDNVSKLQEKIDKYNENASAITEFNKV